jgi:hypothetical protein
VSGPVFMFCVLNTFSAIPSPSGSVFLFCALDPIFDGTEGVRFCFHLPRASGLIFMFCAPRLFFDGTEGVESSFHVLQCQTRFRLYKGSQI